MSNTLTLPLAGPHALGTSQSSFNALKKVHRALEAGPRNRVEAALNLQEGIFDEANTPEDLRIEFRRATGVSEWGKLLGATKLVNREPLLGVDIASGALNIAHTSEKSDVSMRHVVEDILQSMYGVSPEEQAELREKVQAQKLREEPHPVDLIFAELEQEIGTSETTAQKIEPQDAFPNLIAYLKTQIRSTPQGEKLNTLRKAANALNAVAKDESLRELFQAIDKTLSSSSTSIEKHIVTVMKLIADLDLVSDDKKAGLSFLKQKHPHIISALASAREEAKKAKDARGTALRDFYDATLRRVEDTTTSTTRSVVGEFSPLVSVNRNQCERIAKRIKEVNIPVAQEDEMKFNVSNKVMSNLYFAVIAICHQTTPQNGTPLKGKIDGKLRQGWDYLREKWIKAVEENPQLVSREGLKNITAKDIERILFDEEYGSTITDAEGRAKLLNELGQTMTSLGVEDIWSLYEKVGGNLLNENSSGLIPLLSSFPAYKKDPVQKKMFYFLSIMFNQGFWQYKDPENLGTPVDYHELRGHLRYGTVTVNSNELKEKIMRGETVSFDEEIALRLAVFKAIMLISKLSDRTPNDLHYFFWNIFRHTCRREEMFCDKPTDDKKPLPPRYKALSPNECVLARSCNTSTLNRLQDPVVPPDFDLH